MFLADFEGKQKKKKTLNRKERNAFIRFYNHANDTIRRSSKVFLQSVDGDVQLKSSEKDFMGNTESEFINKSLKTKQYIINKYLISQKSRTK